MQDLLHLPTILKWELSLALLVLAWSLVSLARAGAWHKRWRRPRPTLRSVGRGRRSGAARVRPHPLRAMVVALVFATVAASFAYALPNVIRIAPQGGSKAEASRQAKGESAPPSAEPAPAIESSPAEGSSEGGSDSPSSQHPSTPEEQSSTEAEGALTESGEAEAPEPPAEETPDPTPEPTPTLSPEPTPTPTPEPTPTEDPAG